MTDLLAVGGAVLFLMTVAGEHLLTPALNPARHSISEYANADTGAVITVGFLAWTVSLAATGVCLWRKWHARLLTGLLALAAIGMAMTACFATQTSAGALPPGTTPTTAGQLHDLGSGLASLALLAAAIVSAMQVQAPRTFRRRTAALIVLTIVGSGALLAIGPDVDGIRQRLLVLVGCTWQLLLLGVVARRTALPVSCPLKAPSAWPRRR